MPGPGSVTEAATDVRDLYRVPLDQFVAARSALVRRLRDTGDREAAGAAARLRKPSLGAWVVDRLSERHPDLVADLLAAAADAAAAQRSAAAGGGAALRDAAARVRELLEEVERRSRAVLDEAGHPATETAVGRARTTAQAAAAGGRAHREALLHGTLDRDLDPPGFGPAGEPEPDAPDVVAAIAGRRASPRPPAGTPPGAGPGPRPDELEREARRAEREAAERRRQAEQASERASRLRQRADRLAAEARTAADEAAEAEQAAAAAAASARSAAGAAEEARAAGRADGA
jgi:hypothetical protein